MHPREMKAYIFHMENLYAHVYRSFIHSSQKVETTQCPSTDEWIRKIWHSHIMRCYSAMKRNDVMIHATTFMKLENILIKFLSLQSQTTES